VGKRLKQEVAIELGITPSHLSSYLAGWRKISDEQKLKLIELLKLRRSLSQVAILKEEKSQSASPYFSAIPACLFENEEAKRGDKTG
jgi:hypothetical protein